MANHPITQILPGVEYKFAYTPFAFALAADISEVGMLKAAMALPQTGTSTLFTVAGGPIRVIDLGFIVTTVIGAVANATKLQAVCTGLTAVDLDATVDINAAAVGTIFNITGTFANAATLGVNGVAIAMQAGAFHMNAGVIRINCAGNDGGTGRITPFILYRALAAGVTVT